MKHIRKLGPPQSFIDWYNVNNAYLQATCDTGDEIWSRVPRPVMSDLTKVLLKEQGHICAYCGTRIGKERFFTFCVEHFLRKGSPVYKHLTLEYINLLGCCKISQQSGKILTTDYPIAEKPHLKTLKSIADYLDITVENLKKNNSVLRKINENDDLEDVNRQKPIGYKIINLDYEADIHHCDDTKFDSIEPIINPVTEPDCEDYFRYTKTVNNKNEPICLIKNKITSSIQIENTIKILNLNATNLCTDRVSAYEVGERYVNDLIENNLIQSKEDVNSYIENEVYAKTDDKLDPFCFVTASVVWNSFL